MALEDKTLMRCGVVCFTNRVEAFDNGYAQLIEALRSTSADYMPIIDIDTLDKFNKFVEDFTSISGEKRALVVGHGTNIRKVPVARLRGLDILEVQFTTALSALPEVVRGSFSGNEVPYCSIRELSYCLSRATVDDFRSQGKLNGLIKQYRTESRKCILDPLLPLAVLIDGFLVACPIDSKKWFEPGLYAAMDAQSLGNYSVATQMYWAELSNSKLPIERIGQILSAPAIPARGFVAVLMTARELGWGVGPPGSAEAATMYRRACEAVRAAWNMLASKDEVLPGDTELRRLVEAASLGFHVLATGHL